MSEFNPERDYQWERFRAAAVKQALASGHFLKGSDSRNYSLLEDGTWAHNVRPDDQFQVAATLDQFK